MISPETFKEIIVSNADYILNQVGPIIPRHLSQPFSPPELRKVNILHGVRRSGKTFILYDIFRKHSAFALYIDFEDERLRGITSSDLETIRETFFELKPHLLEKTRDAVFLFDEIQNVPGWEHFVRRISEKEGIHVFVAGSSSEITPQRIHTSLRGRAWSISVYPFSFREFLKIRDFHIALSTQAPPAPLTLPALYGKKRVLLKKHLLDYLLWGGFPEISLLEKPFDKDKVLTEYLNAMFFRDLVEKFNITNIMLLDTLKESLFSSFAAKFSLSSFYKTYKDQFPFSKDKLFSYYRHFLASSLIFEARILSASTYKRMRNLPKIYLVDTGLARKIMTSDYGRRLENAVYLELKRRGYEIHYLDDEGECDFLAKRGNGWEAIQSTWELSENNREREIQALIRGCQALGMREGKIITGSQEESLSRDGIRISVIPFWKF